MPHPRMSKPDTRRSHSTYFPAIAARFRSGRVRREEGDMPTSLRIRPLSPACGAVVLTDVGAPLSNDDQEAFRRAFAEYHLLLVEAPNLTLDDQRRLVSYIGPVLEESYMSNVREGAIGVDGEYRYHSDFEYAK